MSGWQDYVSYFMQSGFISQSYIIGLNGAVWANSIAVPPEYELEVTNDNYETEKQKVNEPLILTQAFKNQGKPPKEYKSGIRIQGEKYITTDFDTDREVQYLAKSGGGAVVAKTNICLLVNVWQKPQDPSQPQNLAPFVSEVVEKIQGLLVSCGS